MLPQLHDRDLKQIALGISTGAIFTHWHIQKSEFEFMLPSVFLPIGLGAFSNLSKAEVEDVGLMYEDMSQAGPRSINGYPSFLTVKILSKSDANKIRGHLKKIEQFKNAEDAEVISETIQG